MSSDSATTSGADGSVSDTQSDVSVLSTEKGGVAATGSHDQLRHVETDVLIPKKMRAKAMVLCAGLVKDFEDCMRGRTVSAVWACQEQNRRMKECLTNYYMDPEFFEECKREYLQEKMEFLKSGKAQKMKRTSS